MGNTKQTLRYVYLAMDEHERDVLLDILREQADRERRVSGVGDPRGGEAQAAFAQHMAVLRGNTRIEVARKLEQRLARCQPRVATVLEP